MDTTTTTTKRRRLTVDEQNARTSARHVRAFLSGRLKSTVGYFSKAKDTLVGDRVTTWTGETLLSLDNVRTTENRGAFGAHVSHMNAGVTTWRAPTIVYFSGTDAKGRRWHGRSPGPGMFARLHRNNGPSPRKKPASRTALRRDFHALARMVRLFEAGDPSARGEMVRLAHLEKKIGR